MRSSITCFCHPSAATWQSRVLNGRPICCSWDCRRFARMTIINFTDLGLMNIFNDFRHEVIAALEALQADEPRLKGCDTPGRHTGGAARSSSHGDFATNAALVLAKPAGMKPREIADLLAPRCSAMHRIETVEIAGPGFINLRLTTDYWRKALSEISAPKASATACRRSARAFGSISNMSRPIRPGRCMSAIRAARCLAMRWPI